MSEYTTTQMIERIKEIKKRKDIVILAHHYQRMEVQKIADFLGDSLQLAQEAARVNAEIILFCGVKFMAETAKLLNPSAKVLLSNPLAGCPLADKTNGDDLRKFKTLYPDAKVVCYVNSNLETKAESDICCTSSNAERVVNSFHDNQQIIFVPDKNLGTYVKQKTKKDIILWDGFCNVHELFITYDDVIKAKEKYPDYSIVVHPECNPEVFNAADIVTSTKGMLEYANDHDKIIIGTEIGVYEQLREKYPHKKIELLSAKAVCVNMKRTTLKDVLETLTNESNEIVISKEILSKAARSVTAMLNIV